MAAQPVRRRLDAELVRRGLATSRQQAQDLVGTGRVTVGGAPALKVTRQVRPDEPLVVAGDGPRFVSRGGEKLAGALDGFGIDPSGWRVLDAGSSTGGFTDCLLQRGAARVVAVDVGYGQLHEKVAADSRVEVWERTNVRGLTEGELGRPFDAVVADLSFISLRLVVPALVGQVAQGGTLVLLVKPQFEAGRREVSRGRGVIRDPEVWRRALHDVGAAVQGAGAAIMGVMASPVRGAEGNVEFLLHARRPPVESPLPEEAVSFAPLVDAALAQVAGSDARSDDAGSSDVGSESEAPG